MGDKFRGDIEQLKHAVEICGIGGTWKDETDSSQRFDASNDGILRWWENTGTLSFQGRDPGKSQLREAVMAALAGDDKAKGLTKKSHSDKRIFIVHGHDIPALERLELILRRLDLDPYMLIKDAGSGGTLIEELEGKIGKEGTSVFGIVIMTPDDIGYAAKEGADKARNRARQNVIMEMGMMLASLTRKNVAILRHVSIEQPSDADGIKYISFDKDVSECTQALVGRLINSGFEIDPKKLAAVNM
jgi:predicted nucleotide-binding protein